MWWERTDDLETDGIERDCCAGYRDALRELRLLAAGAEGLRERLQPIHDLVEGDWESHVERAAN